MRYHVQRRSAMLEGDVTFLRMQYVQQGTPDPPTRLYLIVTSYNFRENCGL